VVTNGTEVTIGVIQEPGIRPADGARLGGVATQVLSDHSARLPTPATWSARSAPPRCCPAAALLPGRRAAARPPRCCLAAAARRPPA
jgi:hypothetical protein